MIKETWIAKIREISVTIAFSYIQHCMDLQLAVDRIFARLKNKHIGVLGTNVVTIISWLHWSPVSGYNTTHNTYILYTQSLIMQCMHWQWMMTGTAVQHNFRISRSDHSQNETYSPFDVWYLHHLSQTTLKVVLISWRFWRKNCWIFQTHSERISQCSALLHSQHRYSDDSLHPALMNHFR